MTRFFFKRRFVKKASRVSKTANSMMNMLAKNLLTFISKSQHSSEICRVPYMLTARIVANDIKMKMKATMRTLLIDLFIVSCFWLSSCLYWLCASISKSRFMISSIMSIICSIPLRNFKAAGNTSTRIIQC